MTDRNIFGFSEFCNANPGRNVGGYDYVHAVHKTANLSGDFLIWFGKLMWPQLVEMNGLIYISDLYSNERYENFISGGRSKKQAQFWMNLLEISGIFDDLPDEQMKLLAKNIAECWSAKIRQDFGENHEGARVIVDEENGEVFVVVGWPD
ncbi:hypothetical protein NHH88_19440 [Oxalobacteraceae bacterium OTU3CAMAD1]|nr:hypothetical protein NHH88_19440 [Oxalobacteraceae bacterium OTU3CAMAD1]